MHRLVLWDIDGTLLTTGGVAREVFDRAVARVLGRAPGDHAVVMSGKTDPQIAREILAFAGADEDDLVAAAVAHLEGELAGAGELLRNGGVVYPGVEQVLARLDADPGVVQTVLTGNTLANATVKLAAFGLDRWLDVELGAFGSDNPARNELVPVALERVRRARGRSFDPSEVWVVGDTPFDLACARAGGARCLLVATGRMGFDELSRIGADAVLPDLSDVDAVVALLLG